LAQFNALVDQYKAKERAKSYRAAMICSVIAEVNRDHKRRKKPFTPEDFLPKEKKEKVVSNPQMRRAVERINQMLGGETK
jgi:hypothetical protein